MFGTRFQHGTDGNEEALEYTFAHGQPVEFREEELRQTERKKRFLKETEFPNIILLQTEVAHRHCLEKEEKWDEGRKPVDE